VKRVAATTTARLAAVQVSSADVSFQARVPSVSKPLSLPADEAELQKALDKQSGEEKSCDINVSARLNVKGAKASDVGGTASNMQYAFRQLIQEFEAMDQSSTGDKEAQRLTLAQKFHEHITAALSVMRLLLGRAVA